MGKPSSLLWNHSRALSHTGLQASRCAPRSSAVKLRSSWRFEITLNESAGMPLSLKKNRLFRSSNTVSEFLSLVGNPRARLPKHLSRRLRRDIPLRTTQQLKSHHKLPDAR